MFDVIGKKPNKAYLTISLGTASGGAAVFVQFGFLLQTSDELQ